LKKLKKFFFNINKRKLIIGSFFVIVLLFTYCLFNYNKLVAVYNLEKDVEKKIEDMDLILGGNTVGIKLLATGVLVVGVDRQDTDVKIGDIILEVNGTKIESNAELINFVNESNGSSLDLKINRQGEEFNISVVPKKDELSDSYKLEMWVKDSSAGVGTITFYDKKSGKFGALGHAVTETKENYILPITTGGITRTEIYSIKKGAPKSPGELKGTLTNDTIGSILGNTDKGVYGSFYDKTGISGKSVKIMNKSKIKEGKATIFCTLDDKEIKEYDIEIEKVLLTSEGNKNMIIKITDKTLIEKTGGIIQGMSGSPILQDGKLVGAVTHVFLNDPTKGYGVFIENMIEDMCSIE
jgi:stage IV sporulation protein B